MVCTIYRDIIAWRKFHSALVLCVPKLTQQNVNAARKEVYLYFKV